MTTLDFSRFLLLSLLIADLAVARLPSVAAPADSDDAAAGSSPAAKWLADVDALRKLARPPSPPVRVPPTRPPAGAVAVLLRTAPDGETLAQLPPPSRRAVMLAIIDLRLQADDIAGAVTALRSADAPDTPALAAAVLRGWTRVNGATFDKSVGTTASRRLALPVTRITRARNTADLAALAATLRDVLHAAPSADALANAFVAVQGRATTYDPGELASVFGPADAVDVDTLLVLATTLSDRLAAAEQGLAGKSAADKGPAAREIGEAYSALENMLLARMKTSDAWPLARQLGITRYRRCEFGRTTGFDAQSWPQRRATAFAAFAEAADRFEKSRPINPAGPSPYEDWFNAAAGALNPAQAGFEPQPDPTQLQKMKSWIDTLPPADAEQRSQRLADFVTDEARQASPEFRQQYVRAGVTVIGDRAAAVPLRRAAEYYDAVLADLKLVCTLDGGPSVGVNQPFGVRVALWHTTTLDREVGGFARVLRAAGPGAASPNVPGAVPQNNLAGLVDYRAILESRLRRAIENKLEVVSVVWSDGGSPPLPAEPAGWTQTPLAYLIVKATDVSVDAFPPLQLDLDFADKSDNDRVTLPVVSDGLALDARSAMPRPYNVTSVTQLLDDRTLPAGNVNLEIKVSGRGLLPPIEKLLDLQHTGWKAEKVTESGLLVDRYDTTASGDAAVPSIISQRTCSVTCVPTKSSNDGQSAFTFPVAVSTTGIMPAADLRRYVDGDLMPAEATLRLRAAASSLARTLPWAAGAVLLIVLLGYALSRRQRRHFTPTASSDLQLPESVTPFTATTYLRRLRARSGHLVASSVRQDLNRAIADLESRYYSAEKAGGQAYTGNELRSLVAGFDTAARRP